MRPKEKVIPRSGGGSLPTKVVLPYYDGGPNKGEVQDPEPPNFGVWNPHHRHIAFSKMTRLVERSHHAEILEHDENIPYAPAGDVADEMRRDLRAPRWLTNAGLSSAEE